jgi:hypothetical protein
MRPLMDYLHAYLAVNLTDRCNKACRYCYRTAVPVARGFQLTRQEAMAGVKDASALGAACMFAGGEPTIWRDGGMDRVSLLVEDAKRNGRSAFISNGHVFEETGYARRFLGRYLEESGRPLFMIFSVDFIHGNYDARTETVPFLDDLLLARHALGAEESISLLVWSHCTADPNLNIPRKVFEKYATQKVAWVQTDFMTWGRGADLADLSVYLEVGGKSKASLGPFREALVKRMVAEGKVADAREFEGLDNSEVLKRLSVCGKLPNLLMSWGRTYYYCIPHLGHDWFAVSEIGDLSSDSWRAFHSARPVIGEIQELSVLGLLEKHRALIPAHLIDEIHAMREGTRFAGCSVCLRLHEEGVIEEINRRMLGPS